MPPNGESQSIGPDFLHSLLHDLKGPLARVRILAELLARRAGGKDEEMQALVRHMGASTAAAEAVLEGVRRYAEALSWTYRPASVDLTLAVRSALARLSQTVTETGATIRHGAMPCVHGDLSQLSALFHELIANSLRFRSPDPPCIEIASLDSDPAQYLITVTDNGLGIPASVVDRIFRPLGKASEHAGAGMGLAICRRIAELHGGQITIIPRQPGAEIHLLLPR